MTFLSKIAPQLIPIERKEDFDAENDSYACIQEFPYHLQPYVSQVEQKIHSILKIDAWNWRLAIVGTAALRITTIPFYLVEAALAGISAFFAFLQTRDWNDQEFRHLTCWTGECITESLISCLAPIAAIFALSIGGTVQTLFSKLTHRA